ncbi:MAG TPA: hypothetical protein ENJ18_15550 [Nannocystis exedens]|nr:hypothetical protein [Nannocystis exedens]
MGTAPDRFADNPFFVLGVSTEGTRAEIEREGTKLLGMLELGLRSAATYETPLGPRRRTQEAVRAALAELRIPERRLLHELWAKARTGSAASKNAEARESRDPYRAPTDSRSTAEGTIRFPGAFALFGWRPR